MRRDRTAPAAPTAVRTRLGRLLAALGLLLPAALACSSDPGDDAAPDAAATTPTGTPAAGQSPAASVDSGAVTIGDRDAIDAMLTTRSRAVLAGDEAAFLATVDDRDPALVATQRTLFANLARLPITSFAYQTGDDLLLPDPVPGDDLTVRLQTVERVQVTGTFAVPVGNVVRMTYVKRDGAWLLGAETGPDDLRGRQGTLRPWFGDPIEVADRGGLVVLADAADEPLAEELADLVTTAVRADAALLDVPAEQQLLVDATSNGAPVRMNNLDEVEAAAVYSDVFDVDLDGRRRDQAGGTVRINPGLSAEEITGDPGLLRHELVHFLLRADAGRLPTWVAEGVAEYARWYPLTTADLAVTPQLWTRIQDAPRTLPDAGTFSLDPDVNYLLAQAAVQHLFALGGAERFHVLLDRLRADDGAGQPATEQALREVYGIREEILVRETWANLAELDH